MVTAGFSKKYVHTRNLLKEEFFLPSPEGLIGLTLVPVRSLHCSFNVILPVHHGVKLN